MQSLLILGRQSQLGLAELSSLYGADAVRAAGDQAAVVDVDPCLLAFDRLGGSIKFCKVLTTLDTTNWGDIEKFLIKVSPGQLATMPEGKMHLGLSLYGYSESIQRIEATGLTLKKALRKTGRSVRLVPNKTTELNSAQVIHNKLTTPNGWELIFVRDGQQTIVAQTVKVQDIDAYTRRDRERPQRDSKVGMLPPKLAQIIINLAVGQLPADKLENICDIPAGQPIPFNLLNKTVLDPFCGTGVLLQEASLMGYHVIGTDLEPRMITYSEKNLDWLHDLYDMPDLESILEVGDATDHQWSVKPDYVAAETYLGRPFTAMPTPEILNQTVSDCNLIIKKFLRNLHTQLAPGTRICLAVPAWQTRPGQFKRLPLVDQIQDLGYTEASFEHMEGEPLIYFRTDQIVGRELLVITSK
ncbi:TRM11 family methyltransferase [soil metagenome]